MRERKRGKHEKKPGGRIGKKERAEPREGKKKTEVETQGRARKKTNKKRRTTQKNTINTQHRHRLHSFISKKRDIRIDSQRKEPRNQRTKAKKTKSRREWTGKRGREANETEEQANTDRTKREERIRRITRMKKGEGERRLADQVNNLFFLLYFIWLAFALSKWILIHLHSVATCVR